MVAPRLPPTDAASSFFRSAPHGILDSIIDYLTYYEMLQLSSVSPFRGMSFPCS